MEEGIYVCGWSRSSKGFTLWVKSRPRVRATGKTYEDAEAKFLEAIREAGGAIHAVTVYNPPLPLSAQETKYANPELYVIGGGDRFETDAPRWGRESPQQRDERLKWTDAFFESPICRKCGSATGPRNNKSLPIAYIPSGRDGAFGTAATADSNTLLQIFSDGFIELLLPEERSNLKFLPVARDGRKRFFELIGPGGPPNVAIAGLEAAGWRCTACGHACWGYWIDGLGVNSFIAKSDLPKITLGIFTVGTLPDIQLVATAERWKEMVGQRGTRGIVAQLLGVAPDIEVVRTPDLKPRDRAGQKWRR